MVLVQSPNAKVRPVSAQVNAEGHLEVGGMDTVELAKIYGTPLWVMDEQTIVESAQSYQAGLKSYPNAQVLYAGKAFLCLAMCHLIRKLGLGLDVVSEGELFTAVQAGVPAHLIYMHGNNKSELEVTRALEYGEVNIVVDNESELLMVASIANALGRQANILLRIIPGISPDTHQHIVTGHAESKFGIALDDLDQIVERAKAQGRAINLVGLHAHIGSQAHDLQPYFDYIDIMVEVMAGLKQRHSLVLSKLDVGGGLGIAYCQDDKTTSIFDWSQAIATHVQACLKKYGLHTPQLLIEPGRSIVGTAGVTLYRAGHKKRLPGGITYLSVDGGMADNPRPITYAAQYTAAVANRMDAPNLKAPITLAGKYCESGDIIVKETYISAEKGDLIAVFGTGAYNYSMASNYNRTGRPACVLVSGGKAETIIERETNEDLLRHDRVPDRLR
jgi:diaminopimelate decarboxylase